MPEKIQKKVSVIIADDDCTIRKLFCDFVENSHYEIVGEASNGIEAIELSRKLKPDMATICFHPAHNHLFPVCLQQYSHWKNRILAYISYPL